MDFQGVRTVVNFDFPTSRTSYIHRAGRTARGGAGGTVLSLLAKGAAKEEKTLAKLQSKQQSENAGPKPLPFDKALMEGFRYRVEDVKKQITRKIVHSARMEELKNEMLNSEKLQSHFEKNPADLKLLQHSNAMNSSDTRLHHLASVPSYLMPKGSDTEAAARAMRGPARRKRTRYGGKDDVDPIRGSTSLRRAWQKRHKKGKYSARYKKKQAAKHF